VFEEAAVDLGRALAAFSDSRSGTRMGPTIGFPKPKRKGRCKDSFRLRNKTRQMVFVRSGLAKAILVL